MINTNTHFDNLHFVYNLLFVLSCIYFQYQNNNNKKTLSCNKYSFMTPTTLVHFRKQRREKQYLACLVLARICLLILQITNSMLIYITSFSKFRIVLIYFNRQYLATVVLSYMTRILIYYNNSFCFLSLFPCVVLMNIQKGKKG